MSVSEVSVRGWGWTHESLGVLVSLLGPWSGFVTTQRVAFPSVFVSFLCVLRLLHPQAQHSQLQGLWPVP